MTPLGQLIRDAEAKLAASLSRGRAIERSEVANVEQQQDLRAELAHLKAVHVDHSYPLPRHGVDYSFDRPDPHALRRAGATFAVRYLGGQGKATSNAELRALAGAGLDTCVCFETNGRPLGHALGRSEAHEAATLAHGAGVPSSRPVYFVCDFDAAGEGRVGEVMAYLAGAAEVIGWHRVGVYGGLAVVEAARAQWRAPYRWQTLAWSGGAWSVHAQLRQVAIERLVAGARCDLDTAVAGDFGQFRL